MNILPLNYINNNISNISNISNITLKNQVVSSDLNRVSKPSFATDSVSFAGVLKPTSITYTTQIKKIATELKKMGVNATLIYDGSEKNLIMAKKLAGCLKNLKENGYTIPKLKLHFENCDEYFEDMKTAAAYLDADNYRGKMSLNMYFNTARYKHLTKDGDLCRIKKSPKETSFEADFYHEFAHASQANNDYENYKKLLNEQFDKDTSAEIAKNIDTYATTTKAEFIAEGFAFKMLNKIIPTELIKKLFEQCKGPIPNC